MKRTNEVAISHSLIPFFISDAVSPDQSVASPPNSHRARKIRVHLDFSHVRSCVRPYTQSIFQIIAGENVRVFNYQATGNGHEGELHYHAILSKLSS